MQACFHASDLLIELLMSYNQHFLGACYLLDGPALNQCVLIGLCLQNICSI